MHRLLNSLHNRFAFLRKRIEKKLQRDPLALQLFQACHRNNPTMLKNRPLAKTRFVVMDTETTGLHAYGDDEIIDIALLEMEGLQLTGREYQTLVKPQAPIPAASTAFHGLTDQDVAQAPSLTDILPEILDFIDNAVLVGHHINFDIRFINKTLQKVCHGRLQHLNLDTMLLYLEHRGQIGHYTLEEVAKNCRVEIINRHSAMGDAKATAAIFAHLVSALGLADANINKLVTAQYKIRSQL